MIPYSLSLILFSPLLGVFLLAFFPKEKQKLIKGVAILISLIPAVLIGLLYLGGNIANIGLPYRESLEWITLQFPVFDTDLHSFTFQTFSIDYSVGVDGVSLPLLMAAAIISFLSTIAMRSDEKRLKLYYILFFIVQMGMMGVFLAQNLLFFFIFFELTLIPMYFLVGIWGYENREKAAFQFLLYNGLGSAIMLITFLFLFTQVHTFDFESLRNLLPEAGLPDALRFTLFMALVVAFGIKLPIFPFHTWLLHVHTNVPAAIAMILSGVLLNMGAYGLFRFGIGLFPDLAHEMRWMFATFGLVNLLYGASVALAQKQLKRVLAYSSISHMGIFLFGVSAFNVEGFQGATFQMVSYGLISALLFYIVGVIMDRTGTANVDDLGGLSERMPLVSAGFLIAGFAASGLPFTSGFVSELQSFIGLFRSEFKWIAAAGTLGLFLTPLYFLRAIMGTTFGALSPRWKGLKDARPLEVLPIVVLLGSIFLIGISPTIVGDPLQAALADIIKQIGGGR